MPTDIPPIGEPPRRNSLKSNLKENNLEQNAKQKDNFFLSVLNKIYELLRKNKK